MYIHGVHWTLHSWWHSLHACSMGMVVVITCVVHVHVLCIECILPIFQAFSLVPGTCMCTRLPSNLHFSSRWEQSNTSTRSWLLTILTRVWPLYVICAIQRCIVFCSKVHLCVSMLSVALGHTYIMEWHRILWCSLCIHTCIYMERFDPCKFIYTVYSIQFNSLYFQQDLHYWLPIFKTLYHTISLCEFGVLHKHSANIMRSDTLWAHIFS